METKVNITVDSQGELDPTRPQPQPVVTVLHGDAPKQLEIFSQKITGNIRAVNSYLKSRNAIVDKKDTVIVMDREKMTVTMTEKASRSDKIEVAGSCSIDDRLKEFGINKGKRFSQQDLRSILKRNRIFFPSREEFDAVFESLQAFKANVKKEIESGKDDRGNVENHFSRQIETGLATQFALEIPVIKGEPKKKFFVEICFDITDGSVVFWLESVELFEIEIAEIERIFTELSNELATMEDSEAVGKFTIIHA